MKRVLCLLENGFEEIEAVTPVDLLRRAGIEVVVAGVSGMDVVGKCDMRLRADALLADAADGDFSVLFLPGGPAVKKLRENEEVIALVRRFHADGKLIAAICAAPLVLKDAGVLEGKRYTAHFSAKEELPDATDDRVVFDAQLITSQGAGTALEFGFALVERMVGKAVATEVSKAVMA